MKAKESDRKKNILNSIPFQFWFLLIRRKKIQISYRPTVIIKGDL